LFQPPRKPTLQRVTDIVKLAGVVRGYVRGPASIVLQKDNIDLCDIAPFLDRIDSPTFLHLNLSR